MVHVIIFSWFYLYSIFSFEFCFVLCVEYAKNQNAFRYSHKTVQKAGEIQNLQGFQQNTLSVSHIRRLQTQVCFVDLQTCD